MEKELVFVSNDNDWCGVYIDGKLVDQGHEVNWREVLGYLSFKIEDMTADGEWMDSVGCLPDKLEDVEMKQ